MNIEAIKLGLMNTVTAIDLLKSAKEALPSGEERDEIDRLLTDAGQKLKEAEAKIAREFDFPICKRCWPPEIMIHNEYQEFVCRGCGEPMPDGLLPGNSGLDDLGTW